MVKIKTAKDLAKEKKTVHAEDEMAVSNSNFLSKALDEARAAHKPILADRGKEDDMIKTNLTKMGMLEFASDGSVHDARITPAQEKKILEFAARATEGDKNLIVEMADSGFSVYPKESKSEAKRDYVFESADYRNPKKKKIVESGD